MRSELLKGLPFALMVALLAAVTVTVPMVNANGNPPPTLFLQLPSDRPEPELSLDAVRLPNGEWELHLLVRNFRFTAFCVAQATGAPIGHAHIYRGDQQVASAYFPVVPLGRLMPGPHRFRAMLRGQDHRALVGQDGLIEADITVTVPPEANQ